MPKVVVGVDLGGTNVKTAVVTQEGVLLSKDSRPTEAAKGLDAVLDKMDQSTRASLASAGLGLDDVLAAGFGSPGPLNWQTGIVYETPNLPGWNNVPLSALMEARLGVPCYVDNDANVACYGEFWSGAGKGTESMVLLTLGTGVGGGIVVFGQLLRGPDGTAAEIGHLCVERGGRQCNCGAKGCLEAYASVTGMVRTAVEGMQAGKKTRLTAMCDCDFSRIDGKMISDAIDAGDAFAAEVMEQTGRWLGVGVGSLINLLNPEKVVFCGGMAAAGERLFGPLREMALSQCFEVPGQRAEIVVGGLGSDSGVIGAAGCALARCMEKKA